MDSPSVQNDSISSELHSNEYDGDTLSLSHSDKKTDEFLPNNPITPFAVGVNNNQLINSLHEMTNYINKLNQEHGELQAENKKLLEARNKLSTNLLFYSRFNCVLKSICHNLENGFGALQSAYRNKACLCNEHLNVHFRPTIHSAEMQLAFFRKQYNTLASNFIVGNIHNIQPIEQFRPQTVVEIENQLFNVNDNLAIDRKQFNSSLLELKKSHTTLKSLAQNSMSKGKHYLENEISKSKVINSNESTVKSSTNFLISSILKPEKEVPHSFGVSQLLEKNEHSRAKTEIGCGFISDIQNNLQNPQQFEIEKTNSDKLHSKTASISEEKLCSKAQDTKSNTAQSSYSSEEEIDVVNDFEPKCKIQFNNLSENNGQSNEFQIIDAQNQIKCNDSFLRRKETIDNSTILNRQSLYKYPKVQLTNINDFPSSTLQTETNSSLNVGENYNILLKNEITKYLNDSEHSLINQKFSSNSVENCIVRKQLSIAQRNLAEVISFTKWSNGSLATPLMVKQSKSSGIGRYRCPWPDCGYTPYFLRDLRRHMFKHTGDKKYKCEHADCKFETVWRTSLLQHLRKRHIRKQNDSTSNSNS